MTASGYEIEAAPLLEARLAVVGILLIYLNLESQVAHFLFK
ncbi:MAG: hypothetical protein ACXU9O_14170 [Gemmatimonadaceae bacterium]